MDLARRQHEHHAEMRRDYGIPIVAGPGLINQAGHSTQQFSLFFSCGAFSNTVAQAYLQLTNSRCL